MANTTNAINLSVSVLKTFCNESKKEYFGIVHHIEVRALRITEVFYSGLRNSDGILLKEKNDLNNVWPSEAFLKKNQNLTW